MALCVLVLFFFFFNDTATTEIYTLSLHDALPILVGADRAAEREALLRVGHRGLERDLHGAGRLRREQRLGEVERRGGRAVGDRKSTRLNSSHLVISYAVFCLKKKNRRAKLNTHHT